MAKLGQVANTPAAMEALRVAEQPSGSKPWKSYGPVGASAPNLPTPVLRETGDTQTGGDLTEEHQFPQLASNPMSIQGGYGTFATLAGALIYALHDPHLAVQSHDLGQPSIESFVAVAGENAATKLATITHADPNHADNPALRFPSHDSRLSSAYVTTGNESVAGQGARSQVSHDAEGDTLQKPVGLVDAGHHASVGGYSRDQLMGGGNVDGNVIHRFPTDSNPTSSHSGFDFASGSSRINLAAFGALAWLHMTAASKSIPPHTLAWIYDAASNETVVYVNPTDRVLDVGDRDLLEVHLQGSVSVAESDFADQREGGATVAITLEKLEEALTSASTIDETVLSKDNVQASIEARECTPGPAGVWAILADDGLRFQFGQTRTGLGGAARLRTVTGDSAGASEERDGTSGESVCVSSIEPAHSETATAVATSALKSGPTNADTDVSSPGLNVIVPPGVAMADSADRGNSQHAAEAGAAKAAATGSTEAGPQPSDGVGNGAEHHVSASEAPRGPAKRGESGGAEHGNSGHPTAANPPDAAEIDPAVATADSVGHGNSQYTSERGSAKAAATSIETGVEPDTGLGNGTEHRAPASDATGASAAVKTGEPAAVEHGNSGHSTAANAAAEIDPGVATADNAGHGNSQHTSERGSAKAAATDSIEAGVEPDTGVGNGAEHRAPASDATGASAAVKTAEPAAVEPGAHSTAANTRETAEIVDPTVEAGGNAERGNSQHVAQSAAIASEDAQPAKAASEAGGGDQEPVFRFDSETAPSTLVAVVELKELNDLLDPYVPRGQKEDLEMIVKMAPNAPDEHAANHGNNGPHHGIVPAPHDLLI